MGLYFGSTHIKELYFGSQKIASAYYGNQLVYKQAGDLFPNVKIGNYYWTTENLNINDGGSGILVSSYKYNNHQFNETFYSFGAALRVVNNIPGWHLPSSAEFANLIKQFSGQNNYGAAIRSTNGGFNTAGYTAYPATNSLGLGIIGCGYASHTTQGSKSVLSRGYGEWLLGASAKKLSSCFIGLTGGTPGYQWKSPSTTTGRYSIRLVKDY